MNKFLNGHKTKIAAIGGVLTAVGYFLTTGLADGFQMQDLVTLIGGLSVSLGVLGIGGKIQKVIEALNSKP